MTAGNDSSRGSEARNLVFEIEMKARAAHRYEKQLARAVEGGRAATVEPYKGALRRMIRAAEVVVEEGMRVRSGSGGNRPIGGKIVRDAGIPAPVATFIAAKTVLDSIGRNKVAQSVISAVGARIEDEARFMQFKKREPKLWRWMMDQLERRGSQDYTHKHRVLAAAMHRTDPDGWVKWSPREKTNVGLFLLDALFTTGMIQKSTVPGKRRSAIRLSLTSEAEEAIADREELVRETLRPWFMPILCPPKPWTTPYDGGYHAYPMPMVKTRKRQWLETVGQQHMPKVYASLNAIQATPWVVNRDVFELADMLWEGGGQQAGLPMRENPPAPERPDLPPPGSDLTDDQKEQLKVYKALASAWHTEKMRRQAHVITAAMTLEVAGLLKDEPAIWFPHQLDYRGRAYAVPLFLNPQATDLARGLLRFAESKPVGEMGGYWLAVHGCNCFGNDKEPLDRRVDWVFENEEKILAVYDDPADNLWWTEADEPWQFLAFCLEWGAFAESDYSPAFESSLPVSVDGSCNGLQHFSAMLRDPVGAEATNLTPREKPNDIYQQVADAVRKRLEEGEDVELPCAEGRIARQWLAYGIDRALVKRQVMTTPYGATQPGMLKQLMAEVQKRPGEPPFENLWDACRYLTPIIYDCISQTVMAARAAMDFLQAVARVAGKEELPLTWVTPAGFPVLQAIPSTTKYRIKSLLLGAVQMVFHVRDEERLDRRRQVSASAPNFIHSYDAAHLMLTVCAAEERAGERLSWCFVHDSYGTHAGGMQGLSVVLREEFVRMYANRHALESFRQGMRVLLSGDLPPAPALGSFEVEAVEKAEFFFA